MNHLSVTQQVWCVGSGRDNQTRYHINRTVDGNTLSTLLSGLTPGVLYQVEVAAVTSAGVGTRSQSVSVLMRESTETRPAAGRTGVKLLSHILLYCGIVGYCLTSLLMQLDAKILRYSSVMFCVY